MIVEEYSSRRMLERGRERHEMHSQAFLSGLSGGFTIHCVLRGREGVGSLWLEHFVMDLGTVILYRSWQRRDSKFFLSSERNLMLFKS